jgi:hypothetical protein
MSGLRVLNVPDRWEVMAMGMIAVWMVCFERFKACVGKGGKSCMFDVIFRETVCGEQHTAFCRGESSCNFKRRSGEVVAVNFVSLYSGSTMPRES